MSVGEISTGNKGVNFRQFSVSISLQEALRFLDSMYFCCIRLLNLFRLLFGSQVLIFRKFASSVSPSMDRRPPSEFAGPWTEALRVKKLGPQADRKSRLGSGQWTTIRVKKPYREIRTVRNGPPKVPKTKTRRNP